MVLISKALQNNLIIPAFDAFTDNITEIYDKVSKIHVFYIKKPRGFQKAKTSKRVFMPRGLHVSSTLIPYLRSLI